MGLPSKAEVRVTYWFVFSEFSAANGFNVNWNNNGNFNLNGNNAKSNSNTNNRGVRPVIACSSCKHSSLPHPPPKGGG